MRTDPRIDKILFGATAFLIGASCLLIALSPERASVAVAAVYDLIADRFGLLYQWVTLAAAAILAVLAFGRHGNRRLGGPDARPAYSTLSWMGMLFCAGIGAGLLYWSPIEWAYYLNSPPFGLAPGAPEAREWAATYGIFHWGFSAWCLYCLPTVAIAYPYYQRNIPFLRLSTSLAGLCGDQVAQRPLGRAVDFVFIIALVGGVGTSLGLAIPMIATCIGDLLGWAQSFALELLTVLIAVLMFAGSVYLGLEKGIKRLSDLNVTLAALFALFVLLAGPTLFALRLGTNSLGLVVQEFIRLNTWTDPISRSGFVEDWSIFYWAWWLAYGPFVGLFVTRISRGRTLRQLICGMVGYGTLGCAIFYVALGNTAMWMDMEGLVQVRALVASGQADIAISQIMQALPWQPLPLVVFIAISLVFIATSYDSASYAIAAAATRHLPSGANPQRWHRVFWAFALVVLPIALMLMGGLRAVQSAVLVVSLPVLVIAAAMTTALFVDLRSDSSARRKSEFSSAASSHAANGLAKHADQS